MALVLRSPAPILVLWGKDGTMLYNDAYSAFVGRFHPQLLGQTVLEGCPEDGCPELTDLHARALETCLAGGAVAYRDQTLTFYRHGRRERVVADLDYSPVIDDGGKPTGALAIVVETTERVEAESKVRESAERFRAFLAASTTSMYRMSPDWSEMRQLDGRSFLSDTAAPRTDWLQSYIYPDDQPMILAAIAEAIGSKGVFDLEHRVRLADGSLGWTHSRAVPILDERGEIAEWFGAASDVTARKRAEAALEESRTYLNAVVDSVDQMIWSTRPDGYHDFFNRRWYEYTGAAPGSTDGSAWADLFHPEDRERTFALWQHSLSTGEPYEIEYRLRHRSGVYRWVLGRAHPIRNEAGDIIRWMGTCTDIDEARQVEEALRASEERFRSLYEAQHTAHLVLAPDFTIEAASTPYLQATMTREEDLLGKHIFDAFPDNPDDPAATGVRNLAASLARVLETHRPDRMPVQKYDIRRPSGEFETRWWAPLNIPVFGTDGEIRNLIHQVEDVTAEMTERQKLAEAQAGEARFRELAGTIPGLVFETDADGRNTYVNEQYSVFTGLPFAALLGDGWQQAYHPDDHERAWAIWRKAVRNTQPCELECRIRRADGTWRWFMLRITAVRDAEGRITKGIGVCTDIDDAKLAESELRASEEQFRTMANSLPQLAWMADEKGWIYWYNQRWYEYTGTTPEEVEGWGWRRVHDPEHVDRIVEHIQRAWDTGEPWEDTFPLRGADGQYRWFLSRAVPIRDTDGRVIRWFGTNTDITEQQKREDFQKLLIHEISHRVKNSLSLVSALLQLQARTLEGASRRALEDASLRVTAIATVHDQLWREADAREIDLAPFLSNLAAAIAIAAPQHATVAEIEPAIVSADMAVPIGLFVNELVTNAYKYAYADEEKGEVRITGAHAAEGQYRIDVADCGRGLPADFDLGKTRGSLGMRVVTSLAQQLGGELRVAASPPGAHFTMTFPLPKSQG
jgi:PAS domain S-box-containing protein